MWSEFLRLALLNAALIATAMIALWGLSLAIRDSSIADIFWGLGFVLVVWFTWFVSEGVESRRLLVASLATLWGLRLALYIGWRNRGGEDARYARLRSHVESRGGNYALHSLLHIYLLQGFFLWLVSLTLIFSLAADAPPALGALAWTGALLCVLGVLFESVADWQLARFKADPANEGRVLDRGLWRYTRHPNYFGEACVWVGFFLIAAENPAGLVTVISPLVVFYALLGPTGKGLLERRMSKKRPDFDAYVRRTSGFFPLPPRKN